MKFVLVSRRVERFYEDISRNTQLIIVSCRRHYRCLFQKLCK